MSYVEGKQAICSSGQGTIELRVVPHKKDLGELTVRRVLPSLKRQMVGPFIFFDHMGPAAFPPGQGIQVRPHPHIGIATITYLFEGQIMHRDNLGYRQAIRASAVNLMVAGNGIVHSERAGEDLDSHATLHGIQSWIALPDGQEEIEPSFRHYPASDLPQLETDGVKVTVIMGNAFGMESPVMSISPTLYLECHLSKGSSLELPDTYQEMGAYMVSGNVKIDDANYADQVLAIAGPGKSICLEALADSHVMVIGGEPVGQRHIWWNFVSSSTARIEKAKKDWQQGRFGSVPGDDEFIPLPK